MKRVLQWTLAGMLLCVLGDNSADGRGFGGFGGYRGGFSAGGFSGYRGGSFGGFNDFRGGSYSGAGRSFDSYSGFRGGYGASSSFDRSFTDVRGGSINTSGTRGFGTGGFGGFAAGGERNVTATTAGGRSFSGSREAGIAVGPYGRTVGGASRAGIASGPRGTVAGAARTAFAGGRMPTDFGLAHYSSFNAVGVGHSTAYWSHGAMTTRAGYVRTGFGYYNCFHPNWYVAHPGAWYPPNWAAAAAAWNAATWATLNTFCAISAPPAYYDYGSTIIYQNNNVYVNGEDIGTAQQYAQTATTLADQGQKAIAPPKEEWTPLGVFALVQGEETTSNNLFQLAVNKDGILRGNYYDGLMDTTTPIYGAVQKNTQRAAWTIGKKNDRVFETGIYNLTKNETPVLVHFGSDRTQQLLLVRMEQPSSSK